MKCVMLTRCMFRNVQSHEYGLFSDELSSFNSCWIVAVISWLSAFVEKETESNLLLKSTCQYDELSQLESLALDVRNRIKF